MAATGQLASESHPRRIGAGPVQRLTRGLQAWPVAPIALAVALALIASRAVAERVQLDLGISSDITATNNSLLDTSNPESDVILSVKPRFLLLAEGSRFKLTGAGSFNFLGYAKKTQESGVLPDLAIDATGIAIERALALEAGVRVSQVFLNPFGVRVDSGNSTENKITTTQWRVSPVLDVQSAGGARFLVRSDNTLLNDNSPASVTGPTATGYFARHLALFEQEPRPLGMRAEFDRTYTRYDNTVRPLISDVARLGANRSIDEQLELGLHVGAENNNFVVGDSTSGVYGVDLRWRPSDRTNLAGFVEHRYFGTGGRIVFDHRMPWVAWNMLISRGITTTPQTLFTIGPTNDVTALLDQMYTTRFPDPLARARQVQQVMATAGLPAQLGQSTTVFTQRVSLESLASFRVAYLGERNSIALSASWTRLEDAPDTGPLATGLADNNNTQRLFALSVSRRLTRLLTGTISGGWNTIRSLPTTAAQQTTTETYGDARISALLSPRTSAYFGARHRRFDQDSSGNDNETAGFVGIDHRF